MNEARAYYYENEVEWHSERRGTLSGMGLPSFVVGAPPEFKGHGGTWTPEHLLVASVNACYMLTLLAIAENSKLGFVSFSSVAKGKLEAAGNSGYQMSEIVITPTVVLASADDLGRIGRILEKAKQNCFISNSIKSAVRIVPQVFHQQTQIFPCPSV